MTNNYDVVAMGAGHNGLVAAAYLAKAGKKVLVLERNAETYRRFVKRAIAMLPAFGAGMYAPPTPMGAFVAMMDGSEEGREVLDAMQRSSLEIANQAFESEKVRIWPLRLVSENLQLPDELGTGFGLYLMPGLMHGYGVSQPAGGSGKLSESLVRCIEHYGGEVRCNSEVSKILTSAGRATGVRLNSGEEFTAKDGVIGAIHPHRLRAFVDGVPERVLDRAERTTLAAFSIMVSHYDLKEQAQFHAGEEVGHAIMLEYMSSNTLSEMLDDFDTLKRGRISERVLIAGGDESINDPSRVPPGRGMFHGITFAPYNLEDGGASRWDEIAEQMGDRSLTAYRRFVKNLTSDNIIKRTIATPLDHARNSPNSMVGGDVHGVAPYFYQTGGHRPTADLAQYTVPGVERFYLVGPFQHPGGGVYGAGRATAMRMFEQLGMNFDTMVGADSGSGTKTTSIGSGGASGGEGIAPAPDDDRVTLYGPANEDLLVIRSIEREGNSVVVKGQAYGTMPLSATLRPEQARRLFKLLRLSMIPFLIGFLFRRSKDMR
jgi:phytoene dehydrogenase-like protein